MHLCLLARYRYLLSRISYRAQQIDRQSTLKTAEKENTDCIPFTLTFHPHNHAVKSIILRKMFQLVQTHLETGAVFSQPPLISFKRYRNIGNFFWSKVHLKPKTSLKLSNVLAHDAKTVLSFIT